ncbi:MAG: folylpolyglutamate synthase/dihydrofolate synthase family protein [Amylibacter sp.]
MKLHPKFMDLNLERTERLLATLGHPERRVPAVIHIAGTNGKGSTQAMIRAGLESVGHAVHAYTSPHLARFHERIRLAGELITEEHLTKTLKFCEEANAGLPITYFEITTCAAILAFAQTHADYTLMEVGLGGRVDTTNVFEKPELCVITPVSIDHEQFLGDTLAKIAFEKAGILKRNTFCVVGPQEDEALEVIEQQAAKVGATLLIHGQHWHVWEENGRLLFQDENGLWDLPMPTLIGAHQVQNAGAAIMALRTIDQTEDAAIDAMLNAEWPARLQQLKSGPLVDAAGSAELWLDGGHNAAAGAALSEALERLPKRPLHMITGMLSTKDVTGYFKPLAKNALTLHGVSIPEEAATLSAQETVDAALSVGMDATLADTVADAINDITAKDPTARILICGSLYLAGNILRNNA